MPPITDQKVHQAASASARSRWASIIGSSITSGGIGKKEASAKAKAASAAQAWRPRPCRTPTVIPAERSESRDPSRSRHARPDAMLPHRLAGMTSYSRDLLVNAAFFSVSPNLRKTTDGQHQETKDRQDRQSEIAEKVG